MSEFAFIYVFLIFFAICVAAIAIINITDKKSALEDQNELDFFTRLYKEKDEMLRINMPNVSIKTYMILTIASPFVAGVLFWALLPNKLFASLLALFCVLLPDFIIRMIIDNKRKRYEERYVRALKSLASALKAGMSIQQAIQDVSNNIFISDDLREAFRQIDSDIRVGISIQDAFKSFAEKADNDDARDVACAITMQSAIGGSEGKVIESISKNIEDRLMTRKKIRSIFAATDYMVKILDIAPFLIVLLICLGMPDYVTPILDNPLHMIIVLLVLAFTVFGSIQIRKKISKSKGEK